MSDSALSKEESERLRNASPNEFGLAAYVASLQLSKAVIQTILLFGPLLEKLPLEQATDVEKRLNELKSSLDEVSETLATLASKYRE